MHGGCRGRFQWRWKNGLDLIFSGFNHNELLIFHGKEGGFEKEPKRIFIKDGTGKYTDGRRMCLADFNNDGRLDLFVPSYHDGKKRDIDSYIFWGGPDRNFTPERCTPVFTHSAAGSLAADFNEECFTNKS